MKRYSVSWAYGRNRQNNKITYHYSERTDNVDERIKQYNEGLKFWISRVTDESYIHRNAVNDYYGIKITDSQTKKVVFEDFHLSEEYGYKKEWSYVENGWCGYWKGEWKKI